MKWLQISPVSSESEPTIKQAVFLNFTVAFVALSYDFKVLVVNIIALALHTRDYIGPLGPSLVIN